MNVATFGQATRATARTGSDAGWTSLLESARDAGIDISSAAIDRVAAAPDASHYLLTPQAIARPRNAEEVATLCRLASTHHRPLTFRSGGTSLSGQAVTDGLLVDTRRHFRHVEVLDGGNRVRVQPGATLRQVNARLLRFGRRLGPDPASEVACTIGGIIANNSSGMACGVSQNSYHTLESMTLVLTSGTIIDTAAPEADNLLRDREPELCAELLSMRAQIRADPELATEIGRQYRIKNTMGYAMNALADFDRLPDILAHLIVGSEGTLGFVADAVFQTVPHESHAATALLIFTSLRAATDALPGLVSTGPSTIELMDASSLAVGRSDPTAARLIGDLRLGQHAALLVEYRGSDQEALQKATRSATAHIGGLRLAIPATLSTDSRTREKLWHFRKGLYAALADRRPAGTTALLEDVAVPVEALSRTCTGLQALLARCGYHDAVIFGHAKDGNIHFLITEDFALPDAVDRYRRFTDDLVTLVLSENGSLKAEHGTGRIMAPFVGRQFGERLHEMMWRVKRTLDPHAILSPDIVLTEDSQLHLKSLKTTPPVEAEVDRCVECGFCEPVCPSRDLTTTPRQRIVVRRAMASALQTGNTALHSELRAAQRYQVSETCAVDGMCQTACPVSINTGDLVRRLRAEDKMNFGKRIWTFAARHWAAATWLASRMLTSAHWLPDSLVRSTNRAARRVFGDEAVPMWSKDLPRGGGRRVATPVPDGDYVLFGSCLSEVFAPAGQGIGASGALRELSRRAGVMPTTPSRVMGLCCGTPWKSKGMATGHQVMIEKTVPALKQTSGNGALPVVCENASCTEGLIGAVKALDRQDGDGPGVVIIDAVTFAAQRLLPRLDIRRRLGVLALHPTCSSTRLGINPDLQRIAEAIAERVVVPDDWACCGFAGDRGLLHPELTASATAPEARAVHEGMFDAYGSCNRTCEIGMTRATGRPYRHILELLEEATRD